jgi:hypothetical protein
MRPHVWQVATHAQAEMHFASNTSGLDSHAEEKKARSLWSHSIGAVRNFQWGINPFGRKHHAEQLKSADMEKQVMAVKVCHSIVEDKSSKEQKASDLAAKSYGPMKLYRKAQAALANQIAKRDRRILMNNLTRLVTQGCTFSVAPSPPPLHALRVEVVSLIGTLAPLGRHPSDEVRHLGAKDAVLQTGQHLVFWTCDSGELFAHEVERNYFDIWNLVGLRKSILLQVDSDRRATVYLDPNEVVSDAVTRQSSLPFNATKTSRKAGGQHYIMDLPLQGGAVLSLRLTDPLLRERSVNALQVWANDINPPSNTVCICGNVFRDDSQFCRMCGLQRPQDVSTTKSKSGLVITATDEAEMSKDEFIIQINNEVKGFTLHPRTMRKEPFGFKHPTMKEMPVRRTGAIIIKINTGSSAHKLGLQQGMELISLNGEDVRNVPFLAIQVRLFDLEEEYVEAIFSTPLEPNVLITIKGSDVITKRPPFSHQGMVIEHHNRHGHAHGASDDKAWCGLREHDEILRVGDHLSYHALGDTHAAQRFISHTWKYLRKHPDCEMIFGVRRPSGSDELPPGMTNFFASPYVFRYASGIARNHLATPPITVQHGDDERSLLCTAWISHCGLVISFQPLQSHDFCIGVYVEDIQKVERVTECLSYGGFDYDNDMEEKPRDFISASSPTGNELRPPASEVNWEEASQRYRLTLVLSPVSEAEGAVSYLYLESTSEWTLRLIGIGVMSMTVGIAAAKREGQRAAHEVAEKAKHRHKDDTQESEAAPLDFTKTATEQSQADTDVHHSLSKSFISKQDDNVEPYWVLYKRYLKLYCPERDDKITHPGLQPQAIAGKLAYQTWSDQRIARTALLREQIFPKLWKHVPIVTRVERWGILCTAIQTGFFWTTFLFNAKCGQKPKPASCKKKKGSFFKRFEPTWDTVAATLFGLMLSTPVPLVLLTCFRKMPMVEVMTPKEKKHRILTWRIWTNIGWGIVIILNLFYSYWFAVFTNEFPMAILSKFFNSAIQALVHRFFTAPCIRGGAFMIVLILSKYGPCCDILLILYPKIFIVSKLDNFEPADIDFAFDDDLAFVDDLFDD